MKKEKNTVSNFDFTTIILKPVIPTLLVILFGISLLSGPLHKNLKEGWFDMTDLVTVEIHRASDGIVEHHGNTFPVVNRGDKVIVRVPLPEERRVKNPVIGFNIAHAAGHARIGDQILWSYGEDGIEQGRYMGNLFYRVPVPNELWGETLELYLTVTENQAFSSIVNVQAMPNSSSFRYYFSQFQMDMFLFLGTLSVASMAFVVFLFYRKKSDLRWEGMALSAFCMLLAVWFLSSRGFLYVFSDNVPLCAHTEYVAIYLMPIPFCLFVCLQVKRDKRYRIFAETMTVIFTLIFLVVTVLNYTTANYHYITFLLPLQVLMVLDVIVFAGMLVKKQYAEDLSSRVIRHGVAISMLILMLEVARYNVSKYGLLPMDLEKLSFASTGMLAFAGTLTLGYIARLVDAVGVQSDRALLQRLAFVDVLTGISNRTYCSQKVEEMDETGEKPFALIFFDLNGLKWANDQFGHEMGDALLCSVAGALQRIFGQQQFCGRWGGDEFVVCLTGTSVRYANELLREFDHEIERINESENFPFHVSVAYGMVSSAELNPASVEEAIREADRRMYTRKSKMYAEENLPGKAR